MELEHGVVFIANSEDACLENYLGERIAWNDECIAVAGQHAVDGPVRIIVTDAPTDHSEGAVDVLFRGGLNQSENLHVCTADQTILTFGFFDRLEVFSDQTDARLILIRLADGSVPE